VTQGVDVNGNSGFLSSRVVQVHPTLRCNLSCTHCYSSSAPSKAATLPPAELVTILRRLRAEGYGVLSFSGGEPLVYRGLSEVASEARGMGYRVNLITNGLLLTPKRVEALSQWVSLVGVSLDGPKPLHDSIRGSGTFERALGGAAVLRQQQIPFGIAHTVTSASLPHLPELVDLSLSAGASLLQLHPLTLEGRAASNCAELTLSRADLARLYLLAELFKIQTDGKLAIQLDLVSAERVLAQRDSYGVLREPSSRTDSLSELVNPVVVDERGQLWPLAFGMHSQQLIAGPSSDAALWSASLQRYIESRGAVLHELLIHALTELAKDPDAFVDWYSFLVTYSRRSRVESGRRLNLV